MLCFIKIIIRLIIYNEVKTYTYGFRTALHPLHLIGSYAKAAGMFGL
jgi:hypothetical protein